MTANRRDFDTLWNYDDPAGTERAFRALLPEAQAAGNPTYLTELLTQIARTEGLQQRFDEAHRTLDDVDALLTEAGASARIRYLLERGRVYNSSGQTEEARSLFLAAWDLARKEQRDFYAVDAAHMLAIVEPAAQQVEWAERAMDAARASADPRAQGWLGSLLNNLGWTYHDLGRYEEALATFEAGLAWQEAAGREQGSRIAAWTVGRALRSLGRYEEALRRQEANLIRCREAGAPDGFIREELGECLLALGREEEAVECFAGAYRVLAGDPWLQRDEPQRLERLARLGRVPAAEQRGEATA